MLISSGITVYATGYLASQVTYKDGKTVEQALNDLYKKNNYLQVAYNPIVVPVNPPAVVVER